MTLKTQIEIEPLYDRCVIFNTTSSTYHYPLNNIVIALYFFSTSRPEIEKMSTHKTIFKEVNGEKFKKYYPTSLLIKKFVLRFTPLFLYKDYKNIKK